MRWVSEWGPRVRRLIEIEQATGVTPQALQDQPVCFGLDREVVLCYNYLAARRSIGFGVSPIPLTEIESYIRLFGAPALPIDVFVDLIGLMDTTYLEKINGNRTPGNG